MVARGSGFLRERFGALRNLPPFLALVWRTSPGLAAATLALRLVRALLPVATLFVGKLIIDEVVRLSRLPGHPVEAWDWLHSGLLPHLGFLLLAEAGMAVLSDALGRGTALLDSLLSERFTNASSLRLMEHAASLDLRDFEDSEKQDRLDRARRQAAGRLGLMSQLFGQAQDLLTLVGFAASIAAYAPWLILLLTAALVPAFLGEGHFNRLSYELSVRRTRERRELDYLRQTGASTDTAKEVKLFGLQRLPDRALPGPGLSPCNGRTRGSRYAGPPGARRWPCWGASGYYTAYAFLTWRAVTGLADGRRPHVPGGVVPAAARGCSRDLLGGLSTMAAAGAQYLQDLFSFLEAAAGRLSRSRTRGRCRCRRISAAGSCSKAVGFRYPGGRALGGAGT